MISRSQPTVPWFFGGQQLKSLLLGASESFAHSWGLLVPRRTPIPCSVVSFGVGGGYFFQLHQ